MATEAGVKPWWSRVARFILVAAGVVILIAGLKGASEVLTPLLLAIFLTLLVHPILNWLRAKGLANWLAFLVLAVGIIVIGAATILLISVSLTSLQENVPVYRENLARYVNSLEESLARIGIDISNLSASNLFNPQRLASAIGRLLAVLVNSLTGVALALLLFIFLLIEAPGFPAKAVRAFGVSSPIVQRLGTFGHAVVTYTKVLTLTNLFVGVVWGVLLLVLGVDAALLWGFLAFILQYIPTIGLIIASVPAIIVALLGVGPTTAAIVAVGVIVINSISANVIQPRFSARQLELSAAVVFFSFIFWSWVFGPVGGVLSVILTVGIKSLLEGFDEGRGFALMLGPAIPAEGPPEMEEKEVA